MVNFSIYLDYKDSLVYALESKLQENNLLLMFIMDSRKEKLLIYSEQFFPFFKIIFNSINDLNVNDNFLCNNSGVYIYYFIIF